VPPRLAPGSRENAAHPSRQAGIRPDRRPYFLFVFFAAFGFAAAFVVGFFAFALRFAVIGMRK
jgi:hypothetical protein